MLMRDAGVDLSNTQAQLVCAAIDASRSGIVEIDELLALLTKHRLGLLANKLRFNNYDGKITASKQHKSYAGDSQVLSFEGFRSVLRRSIKIPVVEMPDSELREFFTHLTSRGEPGVTLESWTAFLREDPGKATTSATACFDFIYDYIRQEGVNQVDMFRAWSGDGYELSPPEFQAGLEGIGLQRSSEELDAVFQALDKTGDGTISQEEFLNMIRSVKRTRAAENYEHTVRVPTTAPPEDYEAAPEPEPAQSVRSSTSRTASRNGSSSSRRAAQAGATPSPARSSSPSPSVRSRRSVSSSSPSPAKPPSRSSSRGARQ